MALDPSSYGSTLGYMKNYLMKKDAKLKATEAIKNANEILSTSYSKGSARYLGLTDLKFKLGSYTITTYIICIILFIITLLVIAASIYIISEYVTEKVVREWMFSIYGVLGVILLFFLIYLIYHVYTNKKKLEEEDKIMTDMARMALIPMEEDELHDRLTNIIMSNNPNLNPEQIAQLRYNIGSSIKFNNDHYYNKQLIRNKLALDKAIIDSNFVSIDKYKGALLSKDKNEKEYYSLQRRYENLQRLGENRLDEQEVYDREKRRIIGQQLGNRVKAAEQQLGDVRSELTAAKNLNSSNLQKERELQDEIENLGIKLQESSINQTMSANEKNNLEIKLKQNQQQLDKIKEKSYQIEKNVNESYRDNISLETQLAQEKNLRQVDEKKIADLTAEKNKNEEKIKQLTEQSISINTQTGDIKSNLAEIEKEELNSTVSTQQDVNRELEGDNIKLSEEASKAKEKTERQAESQTFINKLKDMFFKAKTRNIYESPL